MERRSRRLPPSLLNEATIIDPKQARDKKTPRSRANPLVDIAKGKVPKVMTSEIPVLQNILETYYPVLRETLLTPTEEEVLQLIASGLTNQEIAELKGRKELTINRHSSSLFEALGVRSQEEAIEVATEIGILNPSEH